MEMKSDDYYDSLTRSEERQRTNDISKFSIDELESELSRRKNLTILSEIAKLQEQIVQLRGKLK